jgi:hypothetical protein
MARTQLFTLGVAAFCLLFSAQVGAGEAVAAVLADPILVVPEDCPTSGPQQACLLLRFDSDPGELPPDDSEAPAILSVTGSINGQAERSYRLSYHSKTKTWDDDQRPVLPYLGRSAQNKPIILTDAGPLVLTQGDLDLATGVQNVVVIDERRKRVIAEYKLMDEGPVLATETGDGWVRRYENCVSAPLKRPGRLRTNKVCFDPSKSIDLSFPLPDNYYLPATSALLSELKALIPSIVDDGFEPVKDNPRAYGGSGASLRAFRPFGTSLLVAHIICSDCN